MKRLPCPSVLLALGMFLCSQSLAGEIKLDTLVVAGGPSPCLAVQVNISQGRTNVSQVYLSPTGAVKVKKGTLVHFKKGQSYSLSATCITGNSFGQSGGLDFKADGRTVIVQFSENGFQIKRGGIAY